MSNIVGAVQTATISGTVAPVASIQGQVGTNTVLGGVKVGGMIIREGGPPYVLPPATTGTLGGIIVGDDLLITEEGVLSIDKATSVEGDNTRPITAAAVYTEVGNINALLATI